MVNTHTRNTIQLARACGVCNVCLSVWSDSGVGAYALAAGAAYSRSVRSIPFYFSRLSLLRHFAALTGEPFKRVQVQLNSLRKVSDTVGGGGSDRQWFAPTPSEVCDVFFGCFSRNDYKGASLRRSLTLFAERADSWANSTRRECAGWASLDRERCVLVGRRDKTSVSIVNGFVLRQLRKWKGCH